MEQFPQMPPAEEPKEQIPTERIVLQEAPQLKDLSLDVLQERLATLNKGIEVAGGASSADITLTTTLNRLIEEKSGSSVETSDGDRTPETQDPESMPAWTGRWEPGALS